MKFSMTGHVKDDHMGRFDCSCGTVALCGPFFFSFFLADHRATDFTLSKICGTATTNSSHLLTVIFTTKRFVRAESCG